jgi:ribose/xylose/arabinose/galactoside ABC-type transport system permease subunit
MSILGIADAQVITAIAAFELLLPMAVGSFDLSVAAMLGFGSVGVAWLQHIGLDPVSSIILVRASSSVW